MTLITQFKSHVAGKNSDVAVYVDRLEWKQAGMMGGRKGSEIIPIKSISSITTKKDGIGWTKVSAICSGNTIDFRVRTGEADRIRDTLMSLVLGNHPAQSPGYTPPPPPASAQVLPPPPPAAVEPELPPPPVPAAAAPAEGDLIAKLRELGELRDAGVLDDAEFAAAKAKLLA